MKFSRSSSVKGIVLSCISLVFISSFIHPNMDEEDLSDEAIAISLCSSASNRPFETVIDLSMYADTVLVDMMTDGVELSYSVAEIRAKAGSVLLISYVNKSDMSHNVVFVKQEDDIRPVGIAALQAMASDWIPQEETDRIFAHSELAYPGDTVTVYVTVPPPGTYPYICTYSAHWTQMQGRLISIK